MKNTMRGILLVAVASFLAGCTVTETQFNNAKEVFAGSPAVRRQVVADCIAKRNAEPLTRRQDTAAFMNVSLSRYPRAFCNRLMNAWTSGRMTYADYKRLESGAGDQTKFIRVLQGR